MEIDRTGLLFASLYNQHLLTKAPCLTVVSELCGLQAQFANNPKYALRIRGSDFSETTWEEGLVKIWSFRKTLHTVLQSEIGLFLSARGVPDGWRDGWNIESNRMAYWSEFLLDMIAGGVYGREALKAKCREKGMVREEEQNVFHGWGGLIYEMNRRGMIAYAPGTAKNFVLCRDVKRMEQDEARAVLLRRYFKSFGPATMEDCAYFTGWKKREIQSVIEKHGIQLNPVLCEAREYFFTDMPDIGEIPDCIFLSGFDQLLMGYRSRSRMMDEQYKRDVTTNTGIVHPTILLNGRIQAKWKKSGNKLTVTPFHKIPQRDRNKIARHGKKLFQDKALEVEFE
ncbi:hypothetical protein FACS1894187_06630 [Synergistales bacterium]|nr:hypothetical protein FACS1894187_06630 [Synergistales bacterium]